MKTTKDYVSCPISAVQFVAALLVIQIPAGMSVAQDADAPPTQLAQTDRAGPDAGELVRQLGANSYDQREAAERELLALGLTSKAALLGGLDSADLHIRRACRRLLDEVLASDLRKRLDALLADEDGTGHLDLPGWQRFQETVGDDPESRKLYVEMLKAEEGLLESFATGGDAAASAFQLRVRQVRSQVYARTAQQRRLPDISSLAALTFVACDPVARGSVASEVGNIISLYQRKEFIDKLKEGESRDVVRRILGQFILSASDLILARQSLQLAVTLKLEEPGLRLALRLLEDAAGQQQQSVAGAIGVIGLLGGKDFAAAIVPLLDDKRECGVRILNGKRQTTEVRDVAAAWLVKLTDQSLDDYGLGAAKSWFDHVKSNPAMCFSVTNIRFAEEDGRQKCLDKLRAWIADNPLSVVELKPAPKPGEVKPQAGKQAVAKLAQPGPKDADNLKQSVVLADYAVARQLRAARTLVAEREFARVATILGEILASEQESLFQPNRNSVAFRSVKAEAASILNSLPREGLAEYEIRFGPVARHQLDKALDGGDMRALADVERRYLFTKAGRQAAYLLASYHRSCGRLWSASVYLQRLKHIALLDEEQRALLSLELAMCWLFAGRPDAVRDELQVWKQHWPHPSVQLGGTDVAVFADDDDSYQWLQSAVSAGQQTLRDWFVPRGDISGSKDSAGGALWLDPKPLLVITDDDLLEKILTEISDEHQQKRVGAVSTLESLAVGELLIQRTPTELQAIDRNTGQLLWRSPAENALEHLLRFAHVDRRERFAEAIKSSLERRLWDDVTWGALSSNGRLVFAVEDLGFDLGLDYQRIATRLDGTRQLDATAYQLANAISAYDIRTGKLVWQIGEVFGESSPEVRDGRFLGPPLPLGDQLYAVVDFAEDTRLIMLDAADGKVERQWILQVRERATQRSIGSSTMVGPPPPVRNAPPVFADGVLVSSTPDGAFAAVDVIDGSTLWTYEAAGPKTGPQKIMINIQLQALTGQTEDSATDRWASTAATIVREHVLLTTYGSDELHCVELRTGKHAWESPRWDGLFVGALHQDVIVVVGRSGLRGIRLADGSSAWTKEVATYPAGTVPAGRGYLSEGRYYVPLTSGEVAAFHAETGQLAARIRPLEPVQLGNLIPTGEMVVSVGLHGTQRFPLLSEQRAELDAAQANGVDNPVLARNRARFALATGDIDGALDLLTEVRKSGENKKVDELLLEALLQGVSQDPDRFIQRIDSIDDLLSAVPGKANDWLVLAESLAENGRPLEALRIYESLIAKGEMLDQVQAVSASRTLRLDRRLAYGLGKLRSTTDSAHADEVGRRIQATLAGASTFEQLNRYGSQPETAVHSLRLANDSVTEKRWIEADVLLRKAFAHGMPTERVDAIDQLGSLLAAANRPLEAAYWKSTTGPHDAGEEGAEDGPDEAAHYASPWATATIEVAETEVSNRSSSDTLRIGRQMPVVVDSPDGPLTFELSATYESRSRTLTGLDRWGRQRFQIVLPEVKAKSGISVNSSTTFIHGVSVGHLFVLYRGDMVAAIDCLTEEPKLLWSKETGSAISNSSAHMFIMNAVGNRLLGGQANQPGSHSRGIAATGEYVCFQSGRDLMAVDPLTADLLWSRDDLPANCDLTGDRERIFATPPDGGSTSVFRAIDGKLLDRRPALPRAERLAVCGGSMLRWEREAKPPRCGLFDPWQQKYIWQRELAADSQIDMVGSSALGIVEPTGTITVLDAADGVKTLSGKIDLPKDFTSVAFLRFDEAIVCAVNAPGEEQQGQVIVMGQSVGTRPIDGKLFGLEASSGKLLWSLPIANQQLRVNQPSGLPVLIACNRYQQRIKLKNNSYRHESPQLLLKLIDCRDGRVLHDSDSKNAYWANYHLSMDLSERKGVVEVFSRKVELQFDNRSE